jgi:hypothetical protein
MTSEVPPSGLCNPRMASRDLLERSGDGGVPCLRSSPPAFHTTAGGVYPSRPPRCFHSR